MFANNLKVGKLTKVMRIHWELRKEVKFLDQLEYSYYISDIFSLALRQSSSILLTDIIQILIPPIHYVAFAKNQLIEIIHSFWWLRIDFG